jgi:hypothetical protein
VTTAVTLAPPVVSLIVVTYQSRGLVVEAISSALEAAQRSGIGYELIVVDNASADGTADLVAGAFSEAAVIRNPTNRGFGQANNQAFRLARGEYLLLLNPDAQLEPGSIGKLVEFLRDTPAAVGAAPTIQGPGRSESCGMLPGLRSMLGHYFFLNRLAFLSRTSAWRGFAIPRGLSSAPVEVEWASAATLLLRANDVHAVGGFDESMFLYGEDIELCERLGGRGTLWLVSEARASHLIAGSQGRVSTRWVDALDRLYARRVGRLRLAAFDLVMAIGLSCRALGALAETRDPENTLHRRRMAASARRSLALALVAVGRGSRKPGRDHG